MYSGTSDNGDSDNGDSDNGDSDNGDSDNGDSDNGDSDNGDSDNGDSDNDSEKQSTSVGRTNCLSQTNCNTHSVTSEIGTTSLQWTRGLSTLCPLPQWDKRPVPTASIVPLYNYTVVYYYTLTLRTQKRQYQSPFGIDDSFGCGGERWRDSEWMSE